MKTTEQTIEHCPSEICYADGSKGWYRKGKLHREDGPAFEAADGTKKWCLFGKHYSEADWRIEVERLVAQRIKINLIDSAENIYSDFLSDLPKGFTGLFHLDDGYSIPLYYLSGVEVSEADWLKGVQNNAS